MRIPILVVPHMLGTYNTNMLQLKMQGFMLDVLVESAA